VRRKFLGAVACLLAVGAISLFSSAASAAYQYSSAEIEVFNSTGGVIASVLVTEANAVPGGPGGTVYSAGGTALANGNDFSAPDALSTGANANGPYFVTFGVFDTTPSSRTATYELGFSWDPNGNDPNGQYGNDFFSYINPPTQAQYTYSMTGFLSTSALSAGDTAEFILNATLVAVAAPEPSTLALLASGGFVLTAFGRRRRQRLARA
jgi:PEP-CTERM motif